MGGVKHGPARAEDGLPAWVEYEGERYETPPLEELERWTMDSICESLAGETVEPDGYDCDEVPSWLLALDMI